MLSIKELKMKISTLEALQRKQIDIFIDGYILAMKDHNLLLDDIPKVNLTAEFKELLYKKACENIKVPVDNFKKSDEKLLL